MATYQCSKCFEFLDENEFHLRPPSKPGGRPVAYRCKKCRSQRPRRLEVFRRELKKYGGKTCIECHRPRQLNTVNTCRECLQKKGLQICVRCEELGTVEADFMGVQGMCLECWKEQIPRLDAELVRAEGWDLPEADRLFSYQLQKYGITVAEYKAMFDLQKGRCAICRSVPTYRRLAVDHDHKTGSIRGLLCTNCNIGLGNFKDSQELLQIAMNYLFGDLIEFED